MLYYYWGTPLEKTVKVLLFAVTYNDTDMAYEYARYFYRQFIAVNPDFWQGVN